MDAKQLKKNIAIRFGMYAIAIAVVSSLYLFLNHHKSKTDTNLNWLQNDINSLKNKLLTLNQKTLEFSEAVKTWEILDEKNKGLKGLRINDYKDILDEHEKTFMLSDVNTVFSKPKELEGDLKTDVVSTIESDVSITFAAISDKHAFDFIHSLKQNFPGYMNIQSFTLTRTAGVDVTVLQDIANGTYPKLVQGKIDFSWYDMKYNPPKKDKEVETND